MVMGTMRREAEVVIVGGGPGGYVAAIRAADLGREVVLVEERERLGGVCLIEGCIPSKALIHVVEIIHEAKTAAGFGVRFQDPEVDLGKVRSHVQSVVDGLTGGLGGLLARRGVEVIQGRAHLDRKGAVFVEGDHSMVLDYRDLILATGSRPNPLPAGLDLPLWTAADALAIREVPRRLVVVGGGFVGLELALVYAGLGAEVTLVEFYPRLLPGADDDLVDIMYRSVRKRLGGILVGSKVTDISASGSDGYVVTVSHDGESRTIEADQVLVSVGRTPNSADIGLEKLGIQTDDRGHVPTDEQCRTDAPHVYAIGDLAPGPMLAHKASREGKVAAEAIAGHKSAFDNRAIPAAVFTDPELAWTGLTEKEARAAGIEHAVGRFPLKALGRARAMGRKDGLAKIIYDPKSNLVLGLGLVGPQASELIAEGTLALEMGATLEDLMVTIHPHPTLSEVIMEAAEVAAGAPTHVDPAKPSVSKE